MRFPLGAMTVGDILDRGLKLLFARLPQFYIINLIVIFPVLLLQIAMPFVAGGGEDVKMDQNAMMTKLLATAGMGLFVVVLSIILQPIGTAAILYLIMQEYVGKKATLSEAFSFAMSRFISLLGASILVGLIFAIGWLCCCIPGIYFLVSYAFVGQAVVLEKLRASAGLQRSYSLTGGYRWRVFGVLLLIWIAQLVIGIVLGLGLHTVLPAEEIVPVGDGFRTTVNPLNHIIVTLATYLVDILCRTYLAVCTTLLYLHLRIRKEGFDLELATQLGEEPTEPRDGDYDDDRDRDDDRDDDRRHDDDRPGDARW